MAHCRSFVMNHLSNSLTVAHLSWAIRVNCSQWLIWSEQSEQMREWVMRKWANSQPWKLQGLNGIWAYTVYCCDLIMKLQGNAFKPKLKTYIFFLGMKLTDWFYPKAFYLWKKFDYVDMRIKLLDCFFSIMKLIACLWRPKRTQRTQHSFTKNVKEREIVSFFCKRTQKVPFFFQYTYIDIYIDIHIDVQWPSEKMSRK